MKEKEKEEEIVWAFFLSFLLFFLSFFLLASAASGHGDMQTKETHFDGLL